METVKICILGNWYSVPGDLTLLKAIEYAGFRIIRGCGCRGGVCGACATIYRNEFNEIKSCLACITPVIDNIKVLSIPYFPVIKKIYDINNLKYNFQSIGEIYPEIFNCMGCNTCTKICPQNVRVMDVLSNVLNNNLSKAAHLSVECVMCGLCASRCPAGIAPYNIFRLSG